jgi:hypothetical protein
MTQITYHPAFDPYHQIYRTLRLLLYIREPFDGDKLRVADFYLLFPEKIGGIRLSPSLRAEAGRLKAQPRFPYDRMPNASLLFARMEPTFQAAVQTMIYDKLLDLKEISNNRLALGAVNSLEGEVLERASQANTEEESLMKFLKRLVSEFEYLGTDGLKHRTGLEEFRYDAV